MYHYYSHLKMEYRLPLFKNCYLVFRRRSDSNDENVIAVESIVEVVGIMVEIGLKELQPRGKIINISSLEENTGIPIKRLYLAFCTPKLRGNDIEIVSIYHPPMTRYLSGTLISEISKIPYKFYFAPLSIIQEISINNYQFSDSSPQKKY